MDFTAMSDSEVVSKWMELRKSEHHFGNHEINYGILADIAREKAELHEELRRRQIRFVTS